MSEQYESVRRYTKGGLVFEGFRRKRGTMPEVNHEEQAVAANIEKLTKLLNEELEKAFTLGLKTQVSSDNYQALLAYPCPDHLSVRVWRETTLVDPKPRVRIDAPILKQGYTPSGK